MIVKTVVDRAGGIKTLDQALNIVPTPTQFSPGVLLILQERQTTLWIEDPQPHEYFLHLFGKAFLDAVIAETNFKIKGRIYSKVHLGSCSLLETYHCQSWRTFSIFWLNN